MEASTVKDSTAHWPFLVEAKSNNFIATERAFLVLLNS